MRAGAVWCAVRRRHEGVAVDEVLAVEVADVRRAVGWSPCRGGGGNGAGRKYCTR